MEVWSIFFLRLPETFCVQNAPLRPLLVKELWEILSGRALWTMLLLMSPLIGYSFFQAVSLYGEASAAGLQSPVLASGLSPLDGVLVPTLGAFYVAVTLLFPFVAIRVLGQEKESGALRLLVQLPYRSLSLIAIKLAAVFAAWMLSSVPAFSALAIWRMLGGHLSVPETSNLIFGHLLYGLLVGAIALQWHDLKVRITGNKVEGYLDGTLYLAHTLAAPISGRIGLWSKADSYMPIQ
jgi:ABC-2 type transport system permease protein